MLAHLKRKAYTCILDKYMMENGMLVFFIHLQFTTLAFDIKLESHSGILLLPTIKTLKRENMKYKKTDSKQKTYGAN